MVQFGQLQAITNNIERRIDNQQIWIAFLPKRAEDSACIGRVYDLESPTEQERVQLAPLDIIAFYEQDHWLLHTPLLPERITG